MAFMHFPPKPSDLRVSPHNAPRELQKELEALIVADRVAARIDAQAGVLYARHADTRTATFHFALKAGAADQLLYKSCL